MRAGLRVLMTGVALLLPSAVLAQQTPEELRTEAFMLVSGSAADQQKAIELFTQAAEAGDAASMAYLGGLYLNGDGVEANRQTAIDWYLKAVQAGHPGAAAKLAELAAGGAETTAPAAAPEAAAAEAPADTAPAPTGLELAKSIWEENDALRDYEAVPLFEAAAAAGTTEAYFYLGQANATARGVPPSDELALEWYDKAAAAGDPRGLVGAGATYWSPRQIEPDRDKAIDLYEQAAKAGDAGARTRLAAIYTYALNGTRDIQKAIGYHQQNVDAGDPDSLVLIANIYSLIVSDSAKALEYLEKAQAAGAADMDYHFGSHYRYSLGDEANRDANLLKAADYLERAAASGSLPAKTMLGEMALSDLLPKSSVSDGLALLEEVAATGYTSAIIAIGDYYGDQYGRDYQPEAAATWYRRAIAEGDTWGIRQLGELQDAGAIAVPAATGGTVDQGNSALGDAIRQQGEVNARGGDDASLLRALGDYLHAARLGNVQAMIDVGFAYQLGRGVRADFEEANRWYRRAVDGGSLVGMVLLANALGGGNGIEQSFEKSTAWLRRASELGHAPAMSGYADALLNGRGVEVDLAAGVDWLRKGIAGGSSRAMALLGRSYLNGIGVDVDVPQSADYIYRALKTGDALAQSYLASQNDLPRSFWTEVQKRLAADGYYTGGIDGSFGPGTKAAVEKAFGTES